MEEVGEVEGEVAKVDDIGFVECLECGSCGATKGYDVGGTWSCNMTCWVVVEGGSVNNRPAAIGSKSTFMSFNNAHIDAPRYWWEDDT